MRPAASSPRAAPPLRWLLALALLLSLAVPATSQTPEPLPHLTVHVPGSEGGGFDRAAQAMRTAILAEDLAGTVDLVHSPGAGGLIGLSEFLRSETGNPHAVFIAGRSTVGATDFNRSSVSLRDAVPVAGMLGGAIAVAVPEASPLRSLEALLAAFREDPDAIAWVGGSAGSQDELFLLEVADALGVDRRAIDYRPVPGGGRAVVRLGLSGEADVILSSPEELSESLRDGTLRLLATSHQVSSANSLRRVRPVRMCCTIMSVEMDTMPSQTVMASVPMAPAMMAPMAMVTIQSKLLTCPRLRTPAIRVAKMMKP